MNDCTYFNSTINTKNPHNRGHNISNYLALVKY